MVDVEMESYKEVEYIANYFGGTHNAAKSGTLTENLQEETLYWPDLTRPEAGQFVWPNLQCLEWERQQLLQG